MGNCQAIDAATLVIQHPNGKVDKFYWTLLASEVMRMNPGHYVALLLSTTLYSPTPQPFNTSSEVHSSVVTSNNNSSNSRPVRVTKIKLLKPTDTLTLGHVYRLITTQEVMKGLKARKQAAKVKGPLEEAAEKPEKVKHKKHAKEEARMPLLDKENQTIQVVKNERNRSRTTTTTSTKSSNHSAISKSKTWQPSLHSIIEAGN